MTQGTDRGGAPAETVADVGTSGDGSGVDEGPFLSIEEPQYQLVEWRQTALAEFSNVEEAAAAWAALENIEQKAHWWKVEILKQVAKNKWMSEFLVELRETHGINLEQRYANKLRALGRKIDEVGRQSPTLEERLKKLPVTVAIEVFRAEDLEDAIGIAESYSQKQLIEHIRLEKIALADPLIPLELRPWNVWNFTTRTPGQGESGYEWGAMCGQIIEHLLWYYTEPGDLVIDPMAGTGVTYDACKRMQREPRCFDKTPTRPEIKKRDVYDGLPEKIAQLVFLDPPYFDIMESEFQSYDEWLDFLGVCVSHAQYALKPGGYLALILKNKCILRDNPKYALIGDAYEILAAHEGLEFENMILTPLTNQLPGFKVNRAKEERTMLNLARLIWVFRRSI